MYGKLSSIFAAFQAKGEIPVNFEVGGRKNAEIIEKRDQWASFM